MIWFEKEFELNMRPHIDAIYRRTFGNCKIQRDQLDLDIHYHIDTRLIFNNGTSITLQEKVRKNHFQRYDDFTFEYFNNPDTEEPGEWFNLDAKFYIYGYASKYDEWIEKFYIIDISRMQLSFRHIPINFFIKNHWLKHNRPPARANFFAIPFEFLKEQTTCILCDSDELKVHKKFNSNFFYQ